MGVGGFNRHGAMSAGPVGEMRPQLRMHLFRGRIQTARDTVHRGAPSPARGAVSAPHSGHSGESRSVRQSLVELPRALVPPSALIEMEQADGNLLFPALSPVPSICYIYMNRPPASICWVPPQLALAFCQALNEQRC